MVSSEASDVVAGGVVKGADGVMCDLGPLARRVVAQPGVSLRRSIFAFLCFQNRYL